MAFAIGRAYGPAVRRNRLRRRLRALLAELDRHETLPTGMMLISARPANDFELTFERARVDLTRLVELVRASDARPCNA